jgi:hypothetical protein
MSSFRFRRVSPRTYHQPKTVALSITAANAESIGKMVTQDTVESFTDNNTGISTFHGGSGFAQW